MLDLFSSAGVTMNNRPIRFSGIQGHNNNQRPNRVYGPYSNKNFEPRANFKSNLRLPLNTSRFELSQHSGNRPTPGSNINMGKKKFLKNSERNDFPQNSGRSNFRPNQPYFSDPMMLSRVNQYLKNAGRKVNIDLDHLVDELQREHQEYKRKKRQPFKQHVKKAFELLNFQNNFNDDDADLIDEDEDDYEVDLDRMSPSFSLEGDGDVNSTLEDSYMQQSAKKSRKVSESTAQELINIVSSDEDSAGETSKVAEAQSSESPPARKEKDNDSVIAEPLPRVSKSVKGGTKKRRAEPNLLNSKKFKSSLEPVRPSTTFKDIGGNEKLLKEVSQLLVHMRHPEVYRVLGVSPLRGFLLHGPPGSGKTLLAHAISGELKVPLLKVAAPELVGGLSGQSEERIRDLFEQAVALAPCVLFIDEVDAITPNRETAHREMERRIVAQLLSSMDELTNDQKGDQVLVIGATNRPDSLDPALRRAGRFDREVCLGIPDRESRKSILSNLCGSLRLEPDFKMEEVAAITPGYVGADLKSLVTEAAMAAVNRLFKTINDSASVINATNPDLNPEGEKISKQTTTEPVKTSCENVSTDDEEIMILEEENTSDKIKQYIDELIEVCDEGVSGSCDGNKKIEEPPPPSELTLLNSPPLTKEQLEGVFITMADFQEALKAVQPSAKREGFATVPDVKWEDIGSLQDIRHELEMAILAPVRYPKEFASMGLETATGVLLCGPPGCGKTLLAKAIANEAGINFISVKGPELLNMYVGESERAVRQCFQRARSSQPCVIFFDEIDALCPKRTNMENGASRVVNQLLTEMDGVEARAGVFLMAATNRPDIVDPAVMRPGRLDKVLYVGLPATQDRVDILQAVTKKGKRPVLSEDVDLTAVANDPRCDGYTGADLAALVREASIQALKEFMASEDKSLVPDLSLSARHFNSALDKIRPSVSDRDKVRYEDLRLQYAAVPNTG